MANEWREHPALHGKFHPENPDDVQVYVHDGGIHPDRMPELVWVSVTGQEEFPFGDVFSGTVLNQPFRLRAVAQHQHIHFMAPIGFPYPFLVTENYLARRAKWRICLCPRCGMPELFSFGNYPEPGDNSGVDDFKSTPQCPACLGRMVIAWRKGEDDPYT